MPDSAPAIFLSYASQDADAARRICESLRAAGVEVWFDQSELVGGDQWDQKIRGQVKACALFVPVISAATQARLEGYFRLEWKLAAQRTHTMADAKPFLLPVVIDATRDAEAHVPEEFRAVQWTRLPGGEATPTFVARVRNLLGIVAAPEAGARLVRAQGDGLGQATPLPRKRSPLALGAGAFAIVVAIGTALFVSKKSDRSAVAPSTVAAQPAPAAETKAAPAVPTVDPKSIAILPFDNISEDKAANAFFADGMHEDILTNLGVVRELHVTSRTSVMQYRETTKPLRQIGAELGVAYVLEGSVRRAGNTVRVTGQLINARTDEHVWAKSYDRDLTAAGVFAIQSELSQEIVAALSAALSPQEKSLLENCPTTNLAAYDLFLKARANAIGDSSNLTRAEQEQLLLDAVKLDPAFAQAWGYLARCHVVAFFYGDDNSPERLAKARAAIEAAVRLAPGDPEVIESQGDYYYYGYRDYARAAEHYQRLLVLRPNSGYALSKIGAIYRRQGRWSEAMESDRRAVQLNRRDFGLSKSYVDTLHILRRYEEAIAEARRAAELAPEDLFFAERSYELAFFACGSTREMDGWLAKQKPVATEEAKLLFLRRNWAELRGDWALAVQIDRQYPYLDPWDVPHWWQDVATVVDLIGHDELAAARTKAKKVITELNVLLEKQPANAYVWSNLGLLYALDGDKESALRCGRKSMELVPESSDAVSGPLYAAAFAQILAWTGDKERAFGELARLLRTPVGLDGIRVNVHAARVDPGWLPLRGDPRFEALLNDPKNNAPLF
jgi:TolB-like protein/Flp pilus assembly protein TadD